MAATRQTGRPRGRPPAASREDVLEAALYRYLRGQRVDVQAIAAELGLGRATIYCWFGSREELIGEVVIRATEPVLAKARSGTSGKGGRGLLETTDHRLRRRPRAAAHGRTDRGADRGGGRGRDL